MLEWIESAGGPLIALPVSRMPTWSGSLDEYEEACRVGDYLGVLHRPWGAILVLGDEPMRTTTFLHPAGHAIVRWRYAPSEEALLAAAESFDPALACPVETKALNLLDEPYMAIDAAFAGGRPRGQLRVPLPVGDVDAFTYSFTEHDIAFIIHLLR